MKRTKTNALDWATIQWARLREESGLVPGDSEERADFDADVEKDARGRLVDPLAFLSRRADWKLARSGASGKRFRETIRAVGIASSVAVAALGGLGFSLARADRILDGGVNLAGPFVFFLLGQIFFLATSLILAAIAIVQRCVRLLRRTDAPLSRSERAVAALSSVVGRIVLLVVRKSVWAIEFFFASGAAERLGWNGVRRKKDRNGNAVAKGEKSGNAVQTNGECGDRVERKNGVGGPTDRSAERKSSNDAGPFWDFVFSKPRFLFFWGGVLSHLFWASCSICALGILAVRMQGNRFDYCWRTSLEDERVVKRCVDFLGAPVAALGGVVPTDEDVERLFVDDRYSANYSKPQFGGKNAPGAPVVVVLEKDETSGEMRVARGSVRRMEPKTRARWSHFLLSVAALWCVVPRCLLVGAYYWLFRRATRDFRPNIDEPYYKRIIEREEAYSTTTASVLIVEDEPEPEPIEEPKTLEAEPPVESVAEPEAVAAEPEPEPQAFEPEAVAEPETSTVELEPEPVEEPKTLEAEPPVELVAEPEAVAEPEPEPVAEPKTLEAEPPVESVAESKALDSKPEPPTVEAESVAAPEPEPETIAEPEPPTVEPNPIAESEPEPATVEPEPAVETVAERERIAVAFGYDAEIPAERWRTFFGAARTPVVFGDVAADLAVKKRFRSWAKENGAAVDLAVLTTDVSLSPARHFVKFLRDDLGATLTGSGARVLVVLSGGERLRRKFGPNGATAVGERIDDWRAKLDELTRACGVPFEPVFEYDAALDLPDARERLRARIVGVLSGDGRNGVGGIGAARRDFAKWDAASERIERECRARFDEGTRHADSTSESVDEREERERVRVARLCSDVFAIYREEVAAATADGTARVEKRGIALPPLEDAFGAARSLVENGVLAAASGGETVVAALEKRGFVANDVRKSWTDAVALSVKMREFCGRLSPKCAIAAASVGVSIPVVAAFAPLLGGAVSATALASTLGALGSLGPSALASGATGAALGALAPVSLAACKRKLTEKWRAAFGKNGSQDDLSSGEAIGANGGADSDAPSAETSSAGRAFDAETVESVSLLVCVATTWAVALESQGLPEDRIVETTAAATRPLEESPLDSPEEIRKALVEVREEIRKARSDDESRE